MIEYDSRILRLKKQYQGLSRLMTSISDLYIYGVYPQNYPNLSVVLDQAKDHVKQILKETKAEIASLEEPNSKYDLTDGDKIEIVEDYE
jgi:cellulose synthase/poly-beta-1,6-N-acetylglucosamine synthase-like glycosyltransferase